MMSRVSVVSGRMQTTVVARRQTAGQLIASVITGNARQLMRPAGPAIDLVTKIDEDLGESLSDRAEAENRDPHVTGKGRNVLLPASLDLIQAIRRLEETVAQDIEQDVFGHETDDARVLQPHHWHTCRQIGPLQEIVGAVTEEDDAAQVRHGREDTGRSEIAFKGGHADLRRVAEIRPDTKIDAWNLRRHRTVPKIRVLKLADEGECHESIL
jgi:hypothetical protein